MVPSRAPRRSSWLMRPCRRDRGSSHAGGLPVPDRRPRSHPARSRVRRSARAGSRVAGCPRWPEEPRPAPDRWTRPRCWPASQRCTAIRWPR
ncbi:hypothetical protein ACFFX0_04145 [Citricoccus parietis]|uniref:Uncharacterized protein n=1 Tax=Citricoccus parietis TaxID=592307 RepID=A0ABV5FUR1_9MICC